MIMVTKFMTIKNNIIGIAFRFCITAAFIINARLNQCLNHYLSLTPPPPPLSLPDACFHVLTWKHASGRERGGGGGVRLR